MCPRTLSDRYDQTETDRALWLTRVNMTLQGHPITSSSIVNLGKHEHVSYSLLQHTQKICQREKQSFFYQFFYQKYF